MRDHEPVVIEEFNGLYVRGDPEVCPPDHSPDLSNVQFIQSGIRTRDGINTYEPYGNVVRIYTYVFITPTTQTESLLILDNLGNIYHDKSPTPWVPILTIAAMKDFGFANINGRAFINPNDGNVGLTGQFVYVYKGDGTPARKAGATPPVGTLTLANTGIGNMSIGVHVFAVAFETDTGYISQIAGFASINDPGGDQVTISNIPLGDSTVVARRLVATVGIDPTLFTGDKQSQYQFFFIPEGRIADNTTTSITLSFFDAELIQDASYLLNLFTNIPAGVGFATYHNRLVSYAEFYPNISLAYVSAVGQPEAIDQTSGLLIVPLDSYPLTNGHEFQDVLYLFKSTRTFAYIDNGGLPSTWPLTIIDSGIGCSLHGLSTVLDSGGINLLYLIILDFSGVMLFNGAYIRPELSWKIKDYWVALGRQLFPNMQIMNDSISQIFYILLTNNQIVIGDYANGLDFKNIRWAKWTFGVGITSITMINFNQFIMGSSG